MANLIGSAFSGLWRLLYSDSAPPSSATDPATTPPQKEFTANSSSFGSTAAPNPSPGVKQAFRPPSPFFAYTEASSIPPAAVPPATDTDTKSEMGSRMAAATDEIPWRDIHVAHLSQLRGHLKFLVMLSAKPGGKGKLTQQINTTKKLISEAKAAAKIAGIVPDSSRSPNSDQRLVKRKSRLSVTFADQDEVLTKKKLKTRHNKGNKGQRKPTAEALATLRSRLGKHDRHAGVSVEGEEEKSDKVTKRSRLAYLQKDDPLGEFISDEDGDEDGDEVKSEASAADSTKNPDTADAPPPASAAPATETKAAEAKPPDRTSASPPAPAKRTSSNPSATPTSAKRNKTIDIRPSSASTPAASAQTRTADNEPTPKSTKKPKQNPKSPKHTADTDSTAQCSAKKHKKDHPEPVGGV